MKNHLHRSLAIALALLLLNSTFSFAIAKHYCAGELVEISYLGMLDGCMDGDEQTKGIKTMSCCQDVEHLVEASNDEILPGVALDLQDFNFLQLFHYCYTQLFEYDGKNDASYLTYLPPHVIKDIPVFYETFLI